MTENNGGENSINWSGKTSLKKWRLCRELKGNKELDLQSMGENIPGLYGRPWGKQSGIFEELEENHIHWHGRIYY